MATGDTRVLRWPVAVEAGANDLRFADEDELVFSVQTVPAGTYVVEGDGSADDLCLAFQVAYRAAYAVCAGVASTATVTLSVAGLLKVDPTGDADLLKLLWTDPLTTFHSEVLGYSGTATEEFDSAVVYSEHQVGGCWYPRRPHVLDTDEHDAHAMVMVQSRVTKRVEYVCHSDPDSPAKVRQIEWEDIPSARMKQSSTNDATAAAVAGVAVGDPNAAFDNVVRYLLDNTATGIVYVYSTEDPATAAQAGPYDLALPQQIQEFGGVAPGQLRRDLRQMRYSMSLQFVAAP